MDLLPKDIIAIVQRYVFDANYSDLKQQYKQKWLNNIHWDDHSQLFAFKRDYYNTFFVANWRNWIHLPDIQLYGIRTFHNVVTRTHKARYIHELPKRYFN